MNAGYALFAGLLVSIVQAQTMPRIGFVYPAGGQLGTTFIVSVGGQHLNGASAAFFSTAGVSARVTGYERPLSQREVNDLREKLQHLQEKRTAARDSAKPPFTAEDQKATEEIRQTLAMRGNRQATPAVAETVTLEISISAQAGIGEHEIRLQTPAGLSNPLVFCLGELPEHTRPVVTATSSRAPARGTTTTRSTAKPAAEITLPAVVNGQILPGEVDRFRFRARKGQRLTFTAAARALIPYLADAVPGWFQATLAVFDEHGRELGYADDFRFNPDPTLVCEIPADGTYVLQISDAIYRGREDFVYRITAGELPLVTALFPLGGPAGDAISFDLRGWNLPLTRLEVDTAGKMPGTYLLSVRNKDVHSNSVRFALDRGASQRETESNLTAGQTVVPPVVLDGRIEVPGDEDAFSFAGRAGTTVVAEVLARRLGSPLDSVLMLNDAAGQRIAANDDHDDKGAGMLTHHADSRLEFTLPADGVYTIRISDTQGQGGADFGYRLRLTSPQPDFELRVVPSSINVRAGATVPVMVYALRRDGFAGEIRIVPENAPPGLVLSGARIPPGEDVARFTVTAPPNPPAGAPPLVLKGVAMIGGSPVVHSVVPADDRMQAFAYRHLVPAKQLRLNVSGRGTTLRPTAETAVTFRPGSEPRVRIAIPTLKNVRNLTFELFEAPPGITVHKVSHAGSSAEIRLSCDHARVKPGTEGNLIFQAFGERPSSAKAGAAARTNRVPLGLVPAIPFKVMDSTARDIAGRFDG